MTDTHHQTSEIVALAMANFEQWERLCKALPDSPNSLMRRTHECYGLLRGYRDCIRIIIPDASEPDLVSLRHKSVEDINAAIEILQETHG